MVDAIRNDRPVEGPLDPQVSLIGQRIIDTALLSARTKRTQPLLP
jgi:glucose-fructose oxidoreductase